MGIWAKAARQASERRTEKSVRDFGASGIGSLRGGAGHTKAGPDLSGDGSQPARFTVPRKGASHEDRMGRDRGTSQALELFAGPHSAPSTRGSAEPMAASG